MPDRRSNIPPRVPLTLVRNPSAMPMGELSDSPEPPRPTLAALLREEQALRSEAVHLAAIPRVALSMGERRENAARLHAITEQIRANAAAIRMARGAPEERVEAASPGTRPVRWRWILVIGVLLVLLAGVVLLVTIGSRIGVIPA